MNKFDEAIKKVDSIYADQLKRLPELVEKLKDRFAYFRKKELEVYSILEAIIAREGGDKVTFKDAGRLCCITPLADNKIKVECKCDFNSVSQLNYANISKEEVPASDAPIINFVRLGRKFEDLEVYAAGIILAQKVIDVYISYQNAQSNYRSELIAKINQDDDEEESYW